MRLFRNRRRYHPRTGKISPLAIILIVAVAAVLLTIIIGNFLKAWLDDEAYRQLTDGTETEETDTPPIYTAPVRDIRATAFAFGEDIENIWEFPDISVSLNTPTGQLNYASSVAEYFSIPHNEDVVFNDAISDLKGVAAYISGVFYPQAFSEENPELRYAATLRDAAVINEFLQAGGDDILLCNLPFNTAGMTEIFSYVKAIRNAAPNNPVGICIPLSIVQREDAWKVLASLIEICDFCALDVTEADASKTADEWLAFSRYFLLQYDMRLVLAETQTDWIESSASLANLQIITAYRTTEEETE